MNFSEAVEAMKNGKLVMRKDGHWKYRYYNLGGGLELIARCYYTEGAWAPEQAFSVGDILASDWEVIC